LANLQQSLKNSINKILPSLTIILHLGEDFSNMSQTQHSTISTPVGCTIVVAYIPMPNGIKSHVVHPKELH